MRYLYDLFYLLAGLALSPLVVYRALRFGRYRSGWGQRFGAVPRVTSPSGCLWLHAVSVGEVNAAQTVVRALRTRYPDLPLVISTTTDTGQARARTLYAEDARVIIAPLDFSAVVARAFARLRPRCCLLMELEVWPNLVATARRHGVPVVVVNGRISDHSFVAYRRARALLRPSFRDLAAVLAQTDSYAERFVHLGCAPERVVVTGSLKYDTAELVDRVPGAEQLAAELGLPPEARLWVAGGTGPDEEALILEAFRELRRDPSLADLRLALVPRKPERFDPVAEQIRTAGFEPLRYSTVKGGTPGRVPGAVILGDTMGDLRKFYSLATVAFVGRSLVPMGGSDMMEVAALAKPTAFGPHTENFRQTVTALLAAEGAVLVPDGPALTAWVRRCLSDPSYAAALATRGRAVIRRHQGATERTLDRLAALLDPPTAGPNAGACGSACESTPRP